MKPWFISGDAAYVDDDGYFYFQLRGEIVKAYIVLKHGYRWSPELGQEIRNHVKTGLAAHAAPREFEVKDSIPKTPVGSVDRKVLRTWVLELGV